MYDVGVDALLAEYDYDLLPDGRRSGVTEIDDDGNTTRIDWLYDNLGRLTRESYDSYDGPLDFIADYQFDLVGNRLTKNTDTDPSFDGDPTFEETVTYTYDANDRLLTETKDADGTADDRHTVYEYDATQQTAKTVYEGLDAQGTKLEETAYDYNLQGRMSTVTLDSDGDGVPETQLEYEYDDSGIRVAQTKTVDGNGDGDFVDPEDTAERTDYLVDHQNHTGYAQVLEERVDGQLSKTYTLGLDVLAQALALSELHHFLYDGHGSTRGLVDATGQPLTGQIYRYDAYGNPIGFDPSAALTTLLYSGEQLDQLTGLQYLRARYYDLATGRFTRLDPFFGELSDPQSLHKYLYVHADAVNAIDPSGESLTQSLCVSSIQGLMATFLLAGAVAVLGGIAVYIVQLALIEYVTNLRIAAAAAAADAALQDALLEIARTLEAHPQDFDDAMKAALAAAGAAGIAAAELTQLKVLPIVRSSMPKIFAFNVACLGSRPDWHVLEYVGRGNPMRRSNRRWVMTRYHHLRSTAPPGCNSLDEFPFASTTDGGDLGPAEGWMVPLREQWVQGGVLETFYRWQLGGQALPFLVVPVPI